MIKEGLHEIAAYFLHIHIGDGRQYGRCCGVNSAAAGDGPKNNWREARRPAGSAGGSHSTIFDVLRRWNAGSAHQGRWQLHRGMSSN